MEHVRPAVVGAQRVVLGAAIEDDRARGLGEISDRKKILGEQVGDEEALTVREAFLDRSHHIAVRGHDQLAQGIVMAKKAAGRLIVRDPERGAGEALVLELAGFQAARQAAAWRLPAGSRRRSGPRVARPPLQEQASRARQAKQAGRRARCRTSWTSLHAGMLSLGSLARRVDDLPHAASSLHLGSKLSRARALATSSSEFNRTLIISSFCPRRAGLFCRRWIEEAPVHGAGFPACPSDRRHDAVAAPRRRRAPAVLRRARRGTPCSGPSSSSPSSGSSAPPSSWGFCCIGARARWSCGWSAACWRTLRSRPISTLLWRRTGTSSSSATSSCSVSRSTWPSWRRAAGGSASSSRLCAS